MTDEDRARLRDRRKYLESVGALPRRRGPDSWVPGKAVVFQFENETAAEHFKLWMSEQGEQDYWGWMEIRETEEDGPITGLRFDYHKKSDIPVSCGRLDEDV